MPHRSWYTMFRDAFRGIREGVLGERSFAVHLPVAAAVVAAAAFFRVSPVEWLVLILCIALVITAELLNSALERMAKAVTQERNVHVGAALDIAAGAVLVAAIGAIICGLLIFIPHTLRWWTSLSASACFDLSGNYGALCANVTTGLQSAESIHVPPFI